MVSISSLEGIDINKIEEDGMDLQTEIIRWDELIASNPNLCELDNFVSYTDNALIKVREDNRIEFIIKRDNMNFSHQTLEFLSKYNIEICEDISYFNASIVYISPEYLFDIISESKITPGIFYVEPNFYMELDFIPNDEYYESDQWDLSLIGMESAWEYEMGSHDIVVAVVDTGIDYTHPDLSENYLSLGYDWVNDDDDPMDDHYHGTHCAGTIGAIINNIEGVAGMANVSLFSEKAFNNYGSGSIVDCRLALMHAVDMGADIISNSWGSTTYSETLKEAIDYAIEKGVMVIAAAGNSHSTTSHYPAAYPGVIGVVATDQYDLKAAFSNYGDWIDISAPGVNILSTVPYATKGAYYGTASGTSMATPHVSGFAALLMSAFPTSDSSYIENLIYDSAFDLGEPGFDIYFGHGRIDATNIFGSDIIPPRYSDLIESANPLELGNTEVISVNVFDASGVNQVFIEFEGSNHTMTHINGNTWQYDSWTPSSLGTYPYTIYMEDTNNNWGSVNGSIQVIEAGSDITPPSYSNLTESADPLELGDTEIISIDVTDPSGVSQVLIEFEVSNHSMTHINGNTWQYDSWTPSSLGTYPYTIYMEDTNNNWGSVSGSIQVIEAGSDITPPSYSNLTESADPLELGDTEIISIDVTDPSGVKEVLIKYEGTTQSMTHIGGDTWCHDSWTPLSTGYYLYIIIMEDNYGNSDEIFGLIRVIASSSDITPPIYSNLIESADPLELGDTEIISIDVADSSGVNQVLIEFEGSNHSMTYINGNKWQYDSWTPSSLGTYPYTIYMEDTKNNWIFTSNSIQIIDTTSPTYKLLTNETEFLELGNSQEILIKVFDISGISKVLIEYTGLNYSMTNIGGDVWQYKNFFPDRIGIWNYTIYMEDNNKNWISFIGLIEVRDTLAPLPPKIINSPVGVINGKIIFDWEDGVDPSGIVYYKLIIETKFVPKKTSENVFEITIENSGPASSYYELEEPLDLGVYYFFIYQIDGAGHQSSSTVGTFIVTLTPNERSNFEGFKLLSFIMALTIVSLIITIPSYIAAKIKKNRKPNLITNGFEIKAYKEDLRQLRKRKKQAEKSAEIAIRYGNYAKAAELYEECEYISGQLFKIGTNTEAEDTKYYANMRSKTSKIQGRIISHVTYSINELLIKHYDNIGIKYYSYIQTYNNDYKTMNGWILNDKKFLQHRLTNPQNGLELIRELDIELENLSHISTIHFIYTNDLSFKSIIDICQEHQNPNILIFIIGLSWPSTFQDQNSLALPEDKIIKFRENIKVVNYNLFADLIGLDGENKDSFFKIIESYGQIMHQ